MKIPKYIAFSAVLLFISLASAMAQESSFPADEQLANAKPGDMLVQAGVMKYGGKEYKADFCKIAVPENRNNSGSRLIILPVIKIYAGSPRPSNAVFLLRGGPGESNIWKESQDRLLLNHDVVMVGYRGIDGAVSLAAPEVTDAMKNAKNPLSGESLRAIGQALNAAITRIQGEGVDLEGYTVPEVAEDIEMARKALGYKKINLLGTGYGSRVALMYGLRYPGNINRTVMYEPNPPGNFIAEPATVEKQLEYYGSLWKNDPDAAAKSPDILATMRTVFASMPPAWNDHPIDPDRVRIAAFTQLEQAGSAAMVFDAFVAAERGDFSGIAYLSEFYNILVDQSFTRNWVEYFAKTASVDYNEGRDYESEMMPPGAVLGSPLAKLLWGSLKYCTHQFKSVPDKMKSMQRSNVSTLILLGSLDVATTEDNAKKMQSFLRNGRVVVMKEMAMGDDIAYLQPAAFFNAIEAYFTDGRLDVSQFTPQPVSFNPKETFQDLAREHFAQQ